MNIKRFVRTLLILVVLTSNISCDQISKRIVRDRIGYHEQLSLIKNYVTLTKVENTGAFLSLGQFLPQPVKIFLLTILPLIAIGLALIYLLVKRGLSDIRIIGICFVIGGGIGNIYDRLIYGSVTDFVHIDFGLFQTGIFNMADVSIMTGMALILLSSGRKLEFKIGEEQDGK